MKTIGLTGSYRTHKRIAGMTLIELVLLLALVGGIVWLVPRFIKREGRINVRVWITTQNGESMKLGNVPLIVFDEEKFRSVVTGMNEYGERQAARYNELIEGDQKVIKAAAVYDVTQLQLAKQAMRKDIAAYNDL